MDARPVAFDHTAQKHLFKRTLPRFAKQPIEILGLLLVGVLMPVAEELVGILDRRPRLRGDLPGEPEPRAGEDQRALPW